MPPLLRVYSVEGLYLCRVRIRIDNVLVGVT